MTDTETPEQVQARVIELVGSAAPASNGVDEITPAMHLVDDLEFDSIRLMELTVLLEKSFGLPTYDPSELYGVLTVGDVTSMIQRSLDAKKERS